MFSFTEAQLQTWIATFFWPLLRIGGMVMSAPLFNSRQIPMRLRLLVALVLVWVIAPVIPPVPVIDIWSGAGLVEAVKEILVGLAMGTLLQLAFGAVAFGGQAVANTMGLGFASMVDPQNGVQIPVLSQFYLIFATLSFLLLDGHLVLIEMLVDSFRTLPVGGEALGRDELRAVAAWGSELFAGGLLIALPLMGALLLLNLAFGVVTRAAPQLHIFAVGFPLSMILGFAIIWVTLDQVMGGFGGLLDQAFATLKAILAIPD